MTTFEYKVVPAPRRGHKARGVKTTEDRFARALQTAINDLAAEGWEYVRADTLPCEERQGLTGRTTTYQNLLVFRRAQKPAPMRLETPVAETAAEPVADPPAAPRAEPRPAPAATPVRPDPLAADRREPPLKRPGGAPATAPAGDESADN